MSVSDLKLGCMQWLTGLDRLVLSVTYVSRVLRLGISDDTPDIE